MKKTILTPGQAVIAIAYIRVSKEGGRGEDLMSPQIQMTAIREHCARKSYQLSDRTLEDMDKTGREWSGRLIEDAVRMIEDGSVQIIVVWKVSRLARNIADWANAVDRIMAAGGRIESTTESFDGSTSDGQFMGGIFALWADYESKKIGDGWREAHQARFDNHLPVNGRLPFGWSVTDRQVVSDPRRAAVVVELYRRYLAGDGLQMLASWLNRSGEPSKTGARWHPSTVKTILDNPVHAGYIKYQTDVRKGVHTPIITEELWQAYLAQRRDHRRKGRRTAVGHLLSGLLLCGHCHYSMVGSGGATHKGVWYPQYKCDHGSATMAHQFTSVSVRKVDAAVMVWLAGLAAKLDAAVDAVPAEPSPFEVDGAALQRRIDGATRDLERLLDLLLAGTVSDAAYGSKRVKVEAQVQEWTAEMEALGDRRTMSVAVPARAAANLLQDWEQMPVTNRRAELRTLLRHVVVTPGGAGVAPGIDFHPLWIEQSDCKACL